MLIDIGGHRGTAGARAGLRPAGHGAGIPAHRVDREGIPARKSKLWEPQRPTIYRILEREGLITLPRRPAEDGEASKRGKRKTVRDKPTAIVRAHELRADGLSLRKIAEQLQKERILPARCDVWHAASILDLLRQPIPPSVEA